MNKTLSFFGVATAVTMSLASAGMAQAISISTSGVWTSVTPDGITTVNGIDTNTVSWGTPVGLEQSSYIFDGQSAFTAPLDGTDFLLGTFTHNNFPIFLPGITGANLALSLSGGVSKTFNFFFEHNETPNDGNGFGFCPDTPAFGTPCPDIVSIPNTASSETISINGEQYRLLISGFTLGGNVVDRFITIENQANSAQIFGRLEAVPVEEVPEPLTILGISTGVAFGGFLKRKYSNNQKSKVSA